MPISNQMKSLDHATLGFVFNGIWFTYSVHIHIQW